jgi:plasmid stabilization system protein ParE
MAALIYSKPSLKDIENIKNFISADSVANAHRFIKIIRTRITILKKYPGIGKPVYPEKYKNLRQLLYKSYRIIYQYMDDKVTIITVHHQSRLLENVPAIKDYKE